MELGMSLRPLLAITFAVSTLCAQEVAVNATLDGGLPPTAGYTVEIGARYRSHSSTVSARSIRPKEIAYTWKLCSRSWSTGAS